MTPQHYQVIIQAHRKESGKIIIPDSAQPAVYEVVDLSDDSIEILVGTYKGSLVVLKHDAQITGFKGPDNQTYGAVDATDIAVTLKE